jgi:GTP-binding protein YchF
MALSIGIVGLPNVGKSTAFNALAGAQLAAAENYPFCTIEPNRATVPVPDARLEKLAGLAGVGRLFHATVEFVDIAGLVRGASRGEGLGNQFLGHIRDTAAILHVVRCFEDENVVHVGDWLDTRGDIEVVNAELILADLAQMERRIEKLTSQVKGDKRAIPLLEAAHALQDGFERGVPASAFPESDDEAYRTLVREMRFLTAKPVIYLANVDEAGLEQENDCVRAVRRAAAEHKSDAIVLCAQLEADLIAMSRQERADYLALSGIAESGLDQVIGHGYRLLGLISFFTFNDEEARAWTVRQGTTAPQAAGTIHTDFERGFIRAEVASFESFAQHGGWQALKAAGALHVHGRDYVVQDGDVIYFRFNV